MYSYEEVLGASVDYFQGDDLAAKVWVDKYCLRDNQDRFVEKTPADMHRRIAKEFARIEEKKFKDPLSEDFIYSLLDQFKYIIPQGSPMYGIGNPYKYISLSNCYLLDLPLDSYSSILQVDEQLVNISKRRGGVGIDLSNLRPSGSATRNSARSSTGISTWMERYSNSIREVGQNARRGALMLTLSIHHPDIETFISIKNDDTKVTGANISIRLSDEFLKAVENNENYELRFPVDSATPEVSKTVSAKQIWDKIIHSAWFRAEPGLLFWDNFTKFTPADYYEDYKSKGTNPSLRAGTLVLTDSGPKTIDSLSDTEFNVVNMDGGLSKARCKLSGINQSLYEVRLKSGFSYYATKEHRWATQSIEKTTVTLEPGDKLPILKRYQPFNGILGDLDDGFLIGWFLGDGWLVKRKDNGKNQYGFICSTDDQENGVNEKIIDILKRKVNYTGDFSQRERNGSIWYELNTVSKQLDEYMDKFFNPTKETGIATELMCNMSSEFVKGLICGYLSSDGYVESAKKITFTSKHNKLLADISEILGFYGIRTHLYTSATRNIKFPNGKIYDKSYTRYDLKISDGPSKKHFASIFSSLIKSKQDNLDKIKTTDYGKRKFDYNEVESVSLTKLQENVWDITVDDQRECFSLSHCFTHNCSEINLSPLDSCRLLCQNLYSYVINPFTDNAYFDYGLFKHHAKIAQRLMDDLVDLESECIDRIINKIENDPEPDSVKNNELNMWLKIKKNNDEGRRTGTGITALGDTLAALGIKYGSEESIIVTEEIYKTLKLGCYESSVEMAEKLGAFKDWDYNAEKECPFIQRIETEDKELYDRMSRVGRRNIALLTTAPTGTVSCLTRTTSGIEPAFMLSYTRRKKINPNDQNTRVDFVDKLGDKWQEFTVYHPKVVEWMKITGKTDVKESPWWNCCSEDINWVNRVKMQAVAQKHVCHAISSTVNLPESVSQEEVAKIYETAWKSGCKGITVYRKNCRTGVLIDKKEVEHKKEENAQKRPQKVPGDVYHIKVKGQDYFVIVGLLEDEPYEIFAGKNGHLDKKYKHGIINKTKRGEYQLICDEEVVCQNIANLVTENEEGLTRLLSTSLRHGVPLHYVAHQLEKVEGDMQSFAKSVARALKKYIKDGEKISGESCPSCKSENLVRQEGCVTCLSCGNSKCG